MVEVEGGREPSERANRLYWSSQESVNAIADVLGLSKGRLYTLIRPLAAGRFCPDCDAEMVYENRTARERGEASCAACAEGGEGTAPRPEAFREGSPGLAADKTTRLVAGLVLGAAAGILLARFLRR